MGSYERRVRNIVPIALILGTAAIHLGLANKVQADTITQVEPTSNDPVLASYKHISDKNSLHPQLEYGALHATNGELSFRSLDRDSNTSKLDVEFYFDCKGSTMHDYSRRNTHQDWTLDATGGPFCSDGRFNNFAITHFQDLLKNWVDI
jgi:hypothetical protein